MTMITKRLWIDRDKKARQDWQNLLVEANLDSQETVDYTTGIYIDERLVATGSYQGNTIKCIAVSDDYQSENLLTKVVVELMDVLKSNGQYHYFVYTSLKNKVYFESLGFKSIVESDLVAFMEFGSPNIQAYIQYLSQFKHDGNNGAIVMNANPFTNGHLYLIEYASQRQNHVYVFVLSEDKSEFTTAERMKLVKRGTNHLKNVTVLPTADYMVSSATFPSYFLRDKAQEAIASVQAKLDALLFKEKIASVLNIIRRYVGEEPYSKVTDIYNQAMREEFGSSLSLEVIPRKESHGNIISATKVRKAIEDGDERLLKEFLPKTTYDYLVESNRI